MAAQIVYENPGVFKGLFLMGTSHPRDIDHSQTALPILKLYGENYGLASFEEVMDNKNKLPKGTELILIKGAKHSQFGYLRKLPMDNSATLSLEEQQQITSEHLIAFLSK